MNVTVIPPPLLKPPGPPVPPVGATRTVYVPGTDGALIVTVGAQVELVDKNVQFAMELTMASGAPTGLAWVVAPNEIVRGKVVVFPFVPIERFKVNWIESPLWTELFRVKLPEFPLKLACGLICVAT